MGYVGDDSEVVDGAQSGAWDLVPASGVAIGFLGATLIFFLGCWVDFMLTPAPSRATATHQPAPVAVPVLPPSDLAEKVQARKAALLAAEGRELDLLVIVEAPSEMSAAETADQAAELANRLRCKIKVQFQGRKVQASPGMSRVSFVKQSTGFSAEDGVILAIVAMVPVGCWIVFSVGGSKARKP